MEKERLWFEVNLSKKLSNHISKHKLDMVVMTIIPDAREAKEGGSWSEAGLGKLEHTV
jgi:hypothetical protein